jgi:hypothetical protein
MIEVHYYITGGPNSMHRGAGSNRFKDQVTFIAWLIDYVQAGFVVVIDHISEV